MNFYGLLNQPDPLFPDNSSVSTNLSNDRFVPPTPNPYMFNQKSKLSTNRANNTRITGSKKSQRGFLGPIPNFVDNSIMTELSTNNDEVLGGQPHPLIVPTLTSEEIKILQNMAVKGNARNVPKSIRDKAAQHAIERAALNLPLFYEDGVDGRFQLDGLLSRR